MLASTSFVAAMDQAPIVTSQHNPSDQEPPSKHGGIFPNRKTLTFGSYLRSHPSPELTTTDNGNYKCTECSKIFILHEPFIFHVGEKHGASIGRVQIESEPSYKLRAYHATWSNGSTHFVRLSVSQSFGTNSTISQIEEEIVFTFDEFLQAKFERTKEYDNIRRMVEGVVLADVTGHASLGTNSVYPSCVAKWLQSWLFACIPKSRNSRSSM